MAIRETYYMHSISRDNWSIGLHTPNVEAYGSQKLMVARCDSFSTGLFFRFHIIFQVLVNVGKYIIHGSYGNDQLIRLLGVVLHQDVACLACYGIRCQLDDDCWEVSEVPLDEKWFVFFSALPKWMSTKDSRHPTSYKWRYFALINGIVAL